MKEFWEKQHQLQNARYVTGSESGIAGLREFYGPTFGPFHDKTVLCIGVGDCTQIRELADSGAEVHAADISEIALTNAAQWVRQSYIFPRFDCIPTSYFDFAFSHSVSCHITHAALEHHLIHVIRSLKQDGCFFLQNSYTINNEPTDIPDEKIEQHRLEYGGVFRSYTFVSDMIHKCGGHIVDLPRVVVHEPYCGWHGLRIQKINR